MLACPCAGEAATPSLLTFGSMNGTLSPAGGKTLGLLLRITQKLCYVRVSTVWELQAQVVDSRGMWPAGVSTGMLSSSFAVARASLPSTPALGIACRKRNDVPLYSSKLSQEALPVQFFVFSPSQICVNMKREGNNGSCTHQMNQVSQT